MRTIFVLLVYICSTHTLLSKDAPNGIKSGLVSSSKTGLNGLTKGKSFLPPIEVPNVASKDHIFNGTGGLNSSVSASLSGAPVHQQLNESQMPQHMGREHVIESNAGIVSSQPNASIPSDNKTTPNQNHVVPKKGVSLSPAANFSDSSTPINLNNVTLLNVSANATVKHYKPMILESDSDSSIEQQNESKETPISITQIDPSLLKTKSKRADYIIPIVGVIFSVPVVAILISLVYKRGADWWRYRNYKRMDFLIEGMYQ